MSDEPPVSSVAGEHTSENELLAEDYITPNSTPPPTSSSIDQWQHHIDLQDFGDGLHAAARAAFPNVAKSRYSQVSVLMLCWEDEDPRLPVSLEIASLFEVFHDLYHFETEIWKIPDDNPHHKLNQKVLDFVEPTIGSKEHLKIVYYAGHGRLSRERTLLWTSWRNNAKDRCPTVKWSGIQNVLEEAESDVLILLDCCASGVASTNSGNQANELIAACAYNSRANGVGAYSFTNALVIELRSLSAKPYFTVGELYSNIFGRTQSRMPEDGVERHPAPIHLVLTHEQPNTRSIQLSVLDPNSQPPRFQAYVEDESMEGLEGPHFTYEESKARTGHDVDAHPRQYEDHIITKAPRMIFAVRLNEDVEVGDLSQDLFLDWLRDIPAAVAEVKIEAGFESFSTLMMVSLPLSLASYLPEHPAITCLGPITSRDRLKNNVWTFTEMMGYLIPKSEGDDILVGVNFDGLSSRTVTLGISDLPALEFICSLVKTRISTTQGIAQTQEDFTLRTEREKPPHIPSSPISTAPYLSMTNPQTSQDELLARVHETGNYLLSLASNFHHTPPRPQVQLPLHSSLLPTPPVSTTGLPSPRNSGGYPIRLPSVEENRQEPIYATSSLENSAAKRQRRRESHNMVERRRRDAINIAIQDIGGLIPASRIPGRPPGPLETEGRGPNKGEILAAAVVWLKDLLWFLQVKSALIDRMEEAFGVQLTREEARMYEELAETMAKIEGGLRYSRAGEVEGRSADEPRSTASNF